MNCENVLMAMMAAADGESPQLSPEELRKHLGACEGCRNEAARMQQLSGIFQQVTRREDSIDLWPAVNSRLVQQPSRVSWQPFAIAGALLVAYKLYEMLPEAGPGWAITFVPLIIFGALLVFLRENPFKINTDLLMEK